MMLARTLAEFQLARSAGHHPQDGQDGFKRLTPLHVRRIKEIELEVLCIFRETFRHLAAIEILAGKPLAVSALAFEAVANARPGHRFTDTLAFPLLATRHSAFSRKLLCA